MRDINNFRDNGKSYLMSKNDFKFSNINYPLTNVSIENYVQPIIINEFQPNLIFYLTKSLLDATANGVSVIFGDFLPTQLINLVKSPAEDAAKAIQTSDVNKTIQDMSRNPRKYFSKDEKYVKYLKHMFSSGVWLNTYELPFFKETYLESDGAKYWQVNNIQQIYGQHLGEFKQTTLSMDMPSFPSFKIQNIGDTGYSDESLGFSFYLINENETDIVNNFKFLTAFFSGTEWIHARDGYTLGTNVYNIYVPGRFQIYWAALSMKITNCGKLRKYPNVGSELNKAARASNIYDKNKYNLWPEAWLLNINVNNLTVNNFNTYIDNLLYDFNITTYASIDPTKTINTNMGIY